MCGREPLKTLKAVFDNIYVVNSSIHCLVHPSHKSRNLSHLVVRILSGNKRRFMLLFEKHVAYFFTNFPLSNGNLSPKKVCLTRLLKLWKKNIATPNSLRGGLEETL